MTIYAAPGRKNPITAVPHRLLLAGWKSRLNPLELQAIEIELERLVRVTKRREIQTAHWLARTISPYGRIHWDNSSLMHIWEKACQRDSKQTCWCFGLLLWEHMMNRPDAWHVEQGDLDDAPMAGTTYCRCLSRDEKVAHQPMIATT